jgi:hypothetical protein
VRRPVSLAVLAALLAGAGCASSPVLRAAERGDLKAFRTELEQRLRTGDVDDDEARDIARRLLATELATARGLSGERALAHLGACAVDFDDALEERASLADAVAARAAMALADARLVPALGYAPWVTSEHPWRRAAAARTLTVAEPPPEAAMRRSPPAAARVAAWRRLLTSDTATEVRRAALRAAGEASDPGDLPAVIEAARLDPEPSLRMEAVAAVGAIGTREGVDALADLWAQADEADRVAIVSAWARIGLAGGGAGACGRAEHAAGCNAWNRLRRVAETDAGMVGTSAALALVAAAPTPAQAGATEAIAAAALERAIDDGASRVRAAAIDGAPLSNPALAAAVLDALEAKDDVVAAAAAARALSLGGAHRAGAIQKLRVIAREANPLAADRAKRVLVAAGDAAVAELIAVDAREPSARERAQAARRFVALGRTGAALALLGDHDVAVRVETACALLGF